MTLAVWEDLSLIYSSIVRSILVFIIVINLIIEYFINIASPSLEIDNISLPYAHVRYLSHPI